MRPPNVPPKEISWLLKEELPASGLSYLQQVQISYASGDLCQPQRGLVSAQALMFFRWTLRPHGNQRLRCHAILTIHVAVYRYFKNQTHLDIHPQSNPYQPQLISTCGAERYRPAVLRTYFLILFLNVCSKSGFEPEPPASSVRVLPVTPFRNCHCNDNHLLSSHLQITPVAANETFRLSLALLSGIYGSWTRSVSSDSATS